MTDIDTSNAISADTVGRADRGWTPERHFADFWADPKPGGPLERKHPDVVAYWPGGLVARGRTDYNAQLVRVVQALPGLRLDVLEHAAAGELTFIRWRATWGAVGEELSMEGVDRLHVVDGLIRENRIFLDLAEFERLAGRPFPGPDGEAAE